MSKILKLREAVELIWETIQISNEQGGYGELPYLFIIGAGISTPEIISANGIIEHCKKKVKEFYVDNEGEYNRICLDSKKYDLNSSKYYSFWFEQAYKNKIHRQKFLKKTIQEAKISTSNLLLAQILNSKKIAMTVITPNFDNQLLKSLNLFGNYNAYSTNNIMDNMALVKQPDDVQIMHVHGTYQFYDCCNLQGEIAKITNEQGVKSAGRTIEEFLKTQSPIVLGYSGWEDDVIMTKIKERIQYPMPYSLIWFCYSKNDYEILPSWLKDSEDVVFVLPNENIETKEIDVNVQAESNCLPATDVLSALITKFKFQAPSLFSNPLQYYIDIINRSLPENLDVFPVKSWERRLDYLEQKLSDVDKSIIKLEDAAACKNIIEATQILQSMEYEFISQEDLTHVFDGVVMPLLDSKNRIESEEDIHAFLNIIVEILLKKNNGINEKNVKKYLSRLIAASGYKNIKNKVSMINLCDKIIEVCKGNVIYEILELTTLGIKSEFVDFDEKIQLQDEIVERGMAKINNKVIARLILVATIKQIDAKKQVTQEQYALMSHIKEIHSENLDIIEMYYYTALDLCEKGILNNVKIDDMLDEILKQEILCGITLHAYYVKCKLENDISEKIKIASLALSDFDINGITKCNECIDAARLYTIIIGGKVDMNELPEEKYVSGALKLCNKEESCSYICEMIANEFIIYISYVDNKYEKMELCRRMISICLNSKLHEQWIDFNELLVDCLNQEEQEKYLLENEDYNKIRMAQNKLSDGVAAYENHEKDRAGELLQESSRIFDEVFSKEYNPALLNVCFMARRNELPKLELPVEEMLDRIKWMKNNAFLLINKALVSVQNEDWESARMEIKEIQYNVDEAKEWWEQEDVVGENEKYTVIVLLILEKICEDFETNIKSEEFWNRCFQIVKLPEDVMTELKIIKQELISRKS